MSWRYLPPVHSPVTPAGLLAALRALLTGGDRTRRELEAALLGDLNAGRVVLTDSGTTALALAMRSAMEATGRSHIALPGYGCYDLVTALNATGAGVVLYDVDPATLGPDWESFGAALATAPAAVVVVHLYGLPVDLDRVRTMADQAAVPVIEDAAQGAGGQWKDRPLGSLGDLSVLSFGRGKGITGGSGGALLVSRLWQGTVEAPAGSRRGFRDLILLLAQASMARPAIYRIPASLPFLRLGETVYHEPWPARPISGVAAAAALVAWRGRTRDAGQRAGVAESVGRLLPRHLPTRVDSGTPGWLRYPIVLDGHATDPAGAGNGAEVGLMPGYPVPLRSLPSLPTPLSPVATPAADRLARALWTLPTHRWVGVEDLKRLGHLARSGLR